MSIVFYNKYLFGNDFLGYVLGFDRYHICIYIGFYKIIIIFEILKNKISTSIGKLIFIKLETCKTYKIKEKLSNLIKNNQQYFKGQYGHISKGKIYRITRCIFFNLTNQHTLATYLKILGRKFEFDFILSINGYIWIDNFFFSEILLFKEYIYKNIRW